MKNGKQNRKFRAGLMLAGLIVYVITIWCMIKGGAEASDFATASAMFAAFFTGVNNLRK